MYKVLTVGDSNVGKTSLLHRYVRGASAPETFHTIGMDFFSHKDENGITDAILWDTGGMERFDCICKSYYAGSHGILIVYDVVDDPAGITVVKWYNKVRH
jgi:small GTP-binding protein